MVEICPLDIEIILQSPCPERLGLSYLTLLDKGPVAVLYVS